MMIRRLMIAASVLALASACHAKKETNHARAEVQKDEKKTEEAARDARDATIAEANRVDENAEKLGENAAEVTRDAADDTARETDRAEEKLLGENETLPPERGVDTPENGEESPDSAADVTAAKPVESFGTEVTARAGAVDRKLKRIAFRITESVDEISLQSGKEISVPFMDLPLLTGMSEEKAIVALQEAGDLKIRVFGKGDSMRILEIDMDGDKTEMEDVPLK